MYTVNRAYSSMALTFSPALPQRIMDRSQPGPGKTLPAALEMLEDGNARLNIIAPTAQEVAIMSMTGKTVLDRDENGVWTTVIEAGSGGIRPLMLQVDGVSVINDQLPIGYGSSRATNFIELPRNEGAGLLVRMENVPHGAVSQEIFWSETTQNWETCLVYTPAGYMSGTEKYPVLYIQHGLGENERCWTHQGKINLIMDNLLAAGKAKPCLIVMCNGMTPCSVNGVYNSHPELFEQFLINDCIPHIEKTYRVLTDRENRAMAGLSMGSMQTSLITMLHPDLFAYAGIFSGFLKKLKGLFRGPDEHLEMLNDK